MKQIDLSDLEARWPSAYVARGEVRRFSGGAISEKSLANLDCKGEGPPDRIRIGRKVVYPVRALVAWLESRASAIETRRVNPEAH